MSTSHPSLTALTGDVLHGLITTTVQAGLLCLMAVELIRTVSKDASVYIRWGCASEYLIIIFSSVWLFSRLKYKNRIEEIKNSVTPLH